MFDKVRWGILTTANIAVKKVIPAMQLGASCEVKAIASRDLSRAREAANALNIPKAYGSYEELLADESIEVVYNPVCDQYEIQGTLFSQALRENNEQPIPLEDAINNMTVIDAVFRSAANLQWEEVPIL